MVKWEICQLVLKNRAGWSKVDNWWEARQVTPQGEVTIAKSAEFLRPIYDKGIGFLRGIFRDDRPIWEERKRAAHSQVVAQPLAEGWEPAGTDNEGLISVMKRAKS